MIFQLFFGIQPIAYFNLFGIEEIKTDNKSYKPLTV